MRKDFLKPKSRRSGDYADSSGGNSNLEDRIVLLKVVKGQAAQRGAKSAQCTQHGRRIVS